MNVLNRLHQIFIDFILVYKSIYATAEGTLNQVILRMHGNYQDRRGNSLLAEEDGVTLVEMLVVVSLMLVVMGATYSTFAQFEQTTAVSTERLGKSVGRLAAGELRDLDAALTVVLGL